MGFGRGALIWLLGVPYYYSAASILASLASSSQNIRNSLTEPNYFSCLPQETGSYCSCAFVVARVWQSRN